MRHRLIVACLLCLSATTAMGQVSIGIGLPGLSIGINVPTYPELVRVPGHPVYYAPRLNSNFFFYDGMYWVYQQDTWYASSWYNGPWSLVGPEFVPVYVLRVPVRYYRAPPPYFRGWRVDAPPRWGDHWGYEWQRRHSGWDQWNRNAVPPPAPVPHYQRQYSGNRYPQPDQQQAIHGQNYRYQPQDPNVRQHYSQPGFQGTPPPMHSGTPGASAQAPRGPHGALAPAQPMVPGAAAPTTLPPSGKREPGPGG